MRYQRRGREGDEGKVGVLSDEPPDLEKLYRLSAAVAQTPWEPNGFDPPGTIGYSLATLGNYDPDTAAFVEAARPIMLLALIERIRDLERERKTLRWYMCNDNEAAANEAMERGDYVD